MSNFNYFQKGEVAIRVASDEWFDENTPIRVFEPMGYRYREFKDTLGAYIELFNEECYIGNSIYDISFIEPTGGFIRGCGNNPLDDNYEYCLRYSDSIHKDLMGYGRGW